MLRLYEHGEARARVEGEDSEVEAHGWEFAPGDTIEIDGENWILRNVSDSIQTGDARGNFRYAWADPMRSGTFRLSTANDGSWGNSGETDEQVVSYCEELGTMIERAFPGVTVELVAGPVSARQRCTDEDLGEEIKAFVQDNYGAAIDAADRGPGRPPLNPKGGRTTPARIRLSDANLEEVGLLIADGVGRNTSEVIRALLDDRAEIRATVDRIQREKKKGKRKRK